MLPPLLHIRLPVIYEQPKDKSKVIIVITPTLFLVLQSLVVMGSPSPSPPSLLYTKISRLFFKYLEAFCECFWTGSPFTSVFAHQPLMRFLSYAPTEVSVYSSIRKATIRESLFSLLSCLFCFLPTRFPGLALTTVFLHELHSSGPQVS